MMSSVRGCIICKQPIDPDRLEAVPTTRLCVEHAIAIRKFGGEFILTSEQERTSKAGSLKKNYGAVTTSQIRNDTAIEKLRAEFANTQQ